MGQNRSSGEKRRGDTLRGLAVRGLAAAALGTAGSAEAAFLYWSAPQVRTASVASCYSFAQTAMTRLGFTNIRRSTAEVTGTRGGVYAAVTCFPTTPRATAMVMTVGDDGGEVARVRDGLATTIARVVNID